MALSQLPGRLTQVSLARPTRLCRFVRILRRDRRGGRASETRTAAGKVGQVIINTWRLTLPGRFHRGGVGVGAGGVGGGGRGEEDGVAGKRFT